MALHVPDFLQTQLYPAQALRESFLDGIHQEGVVLDSPGILTPLKVTQRAAGANMSVDVAAGGAWIKGEYSYRQGLYHVFNDAVVNLSVPANGSALNPRLDQVILRVSDTTDGGAGSDSASIELLAGTASSGATLTNRTGAAALPSGAIRLADILTPPSATSITTAAIRDRRPWAHGASFFRARTTDQALTNSLALIPTFSTRLEVANPVQVSFNALVEMPSVANTTYTVALYVDGIITFQKTVTLAAAGSTNGVDATFTWDPALKSPSALPISVNFELYQNILSGTGTLNGSATFPATMSVREFQQLSAHNE